MRGRRLAQSVADTAAAMDAAAAGAYTVTSSSSSSAVLEDLWAVANTTTTQVTILNSSSIADSAAAIAVADSAAAAPGTAAAAAAAAAAVLPDPAATPAAPATGDVTAQHSRGSRARTFGRNSNINRAAEAVVVMLQGRATSTQAPWLSGLSGECTRMRSTGRTALTAPVTACWVPAGESPLRDKQRQQQQQAFIGLLQ